MKNIHIMKSRTFFAQIFLFAIVMVMSWNVQSVFAIAAPSGLSATCGTGGTSVTTHWTPVSGSTAQAIRFDGATPSWNPGACTTMNSGDLCQDLGASVNQSYQKISPDVPYLWWVHAIDAGGWSAASTGTFNCPATYTLTVNKTANGGTVTSSNAISCSSVSAASCTKSSTSNANVTLTPTAEAGYVFSSWSGCDSVASGTNICTVMMSGARTVTANFVVASANYTLSIGKTGSGSVTSNPVGINCTGTDAATSNPTACTKSYSAGTAVTLTATPISGQSFVGWSGPCSGTGTCTVTMDANRSATANFSTFPPPPSNLGPTCASDGTSVTYTWTGATGASGYAVRMDVNPDSFDTSTCASGGYGANGDYCKDNIGNTTSVTLTTAPNVVHNFWVQSRGSSGEWGGSVLRTNITCASAAAPNPPTGLTASCAAGGVSVNLGWSSVSGAASYALRADKNPSTWSDVWWANSGKCTTAGYFTTTLDSSYPGGTGDYCQNGLTSTSKTLSIAPDTNYLWWVHTVSGTGVWSATSQSVNVNCPSVAPVVPSTPTGLNLSAGCDGSIPKVNLAWNNVSGATTYDVQWCTGSVCTPSTLISGISTNVYAHTNRVVGTTYGYRVRATNSAGSSAYSATQYATAQSCAALAGCSAGVSKTWFVGLNSCTATTPAANSGINGILTDSTAPLTGTASYLCTNGTWAPTPIAGATCSAAPLPNLISTNVSHTGTVQEGQTVTINAQAGNTSTVSTGVGFTDVFEYRYGAIGTFTGFDAEVNVALAAGGTDNDSATYTIPSGKAGDTLYIQHCIDSLGQVTEADESVADNCKIINLGVVAAPAFASCAAGTNRTWTVGMYSCVAATPAASSGTNGVLIDSVSAETGTASYLCTNGTWAATPNVGATCISTPVAPELTVDKRLVEQGDTVELTYHPNGQTCTLSGGGLNFTGLNSDGTKSSLPISGRTTYTLSCPIGSDSVTVEVVPRGWES